jgi:hypothetical protein
MGNSILEAISQLEGVNIIEPVLHMAVHNQFGHTQNFSTQMERISKSALLTLLCGQSFDRFQVEIVIQMEIVQILSVNKKIQHVVTLSADL